MGRRGSLGIVVALVLVSGCALPQRDVRILKLDTGAPSVITFPASLRGTYVPKKDAVLKVCAEPTPDVDLDSVAKITANLKGTVPSGVTGEAGLSTDWESKVVELAGRTQLLLIARELLFRACELSLNYPDAGKDTALKMYDTVVKLVEALGAADKTRAEADSKRADAALSNAKAALERVLKGTK